MSDQIKLSEQDLEVVGGGAGGSWRNYAKGSFLNYGQYIVYTFAPGDVLSGIAIRFGVTVSELQQWNNIRNPDVIGVGQTLTIYARTLR